MGRRPMNDRILVVCMDEARYLLTKEEGDPVGWFQRLRRALAAASQRIRGRYGHRAGVFANLVDTNSKVADFVPPAAQDKSNTRSELFPPFVLTQTMDVRFDAMVERATGDGRRREQFYMELVQKGYGEAWRNLVLMGRPLWDRGKIDNPKRKEGASDVIQLAADKLLGGLSAEHDESFNEKSMFGVASMLCRVGLRPSSWSPFASRAIADLMAVLLHTNITHDQLLTSYSSDPVLTFGAARVWYQSAEPNELSTLAKHILPQLRKLLRQDVVATGDIDEFVRRIVLLLAMDTTGAVDALSPSREYAGDFRSVCTFLNVLYGIQGKSPRVLDQFLQPSASAQGVGEMLTSLCNWKVGFSHFVQVTEEPTEQMLWAMLVRRAAGIFPRNFKGVDLFIPTFMDEKVSMIVVQVKNHAGTDSSFPDSASISMRPSLVFNNEFKEKHPSDNVRIYMSLRGTEPTVRDQYYLVDEGVHRSKRIAVAASKTDAPKTNASAGKSSQESYVLCLLGLGPWDTKREASEITPPGATPRTVPVVSSDVAEELQKLLMPWWRVMDLVEEDLARRGRRIGVNEDVVRLVASRPLVESLCTGRQDEAPVAAAAATMEEVRDTVAARHARPKHGRPLSPDEEDKREWLTVQGSKKKKASRH